MLVLLGIMLVTGIFMVHALLTDKSVYYVNEPVTINIADPTNVELWMNDAQKLVPSTYNSVFIPQQPGKYNLCLANRTNSEKIECVEFDVIMESINYTNNLTAAIDVKDNYILGNTVFVTAYVLSGQETFEQYYLDIQYGQEFFRYIGYNIGDTLSFVPQNIGSYQVILSNNKGIIATRTFVVDSLKYQNEQNNGLDNAINQSDTVNDAANNENSRSTISSIDATQLTGRMPYVEVVNGKNSKLKGNVKLLESINGGISGYDIMMNIDNPKYTSARFNNVKDNFVVALDTPIMPLVHEYFGDFVKSVAFDPKGSQFSDGYINFTAEGDELWKCKDYDFDAQVCNGNFEKIMDLIPGQEYSILVDPLDPLWSEVKTLACTCQGSTPSIPGQKSTAACNVYCPVNFTVDSSFYDAFIQQVSYNVTIIITTTSAGSGAEQGYLDMDQVQANGNESSIGSSTYAGSGTSIVTWTSASLPSTSFNKNNCPTWASGYCTWNVFLNISATTAGANKAIVANISLNKLNYTWNYTEFPPKTINITLVFPDIAQIINYRNINFSYIASSTENLTNCSLYDNEASWSLKQTNFGIVNGSNNYMNKTFGSDGFYTWNIECYTPSNGTFANTNRTFTIDTAAPYIMQVNPGIAATWNSSNVVTFTYNVTDLTTINNCSLYIDGLRVKTSLSVTKGTDQTITYYLNNGVYNWSIGCYDEANNFNMTQNRSLNVSVPPRILTGLWYETYDSNCNAFTCDVNLEQYTDGTSNHVYGTIPSSLSVDMVHAPSPYISANGAFIGTGSTVTFSTYFSSVPDSGLTARWYLYYRNNSGQDVLICSNTAGVGMSTGSISTGTCNTAANIRMLSTDQLYYVIEAQNGPPNRNKVANHTIDYATSFVNISNFQQLGYLTTTMIAPTTNLTILQGDSFTMTCNITCALGYCISTNVLAQQNSSGAWTNITNSGVLSLNSTETNPHSLGNMFNGSTTTSFAINTTAPGTSYIRCGGISNFSSDNSDEIITITVVNNNPPIVNLSRPGNNTWNNSVYMIFNYTPYSYSSLLNCTLYLDGAYNYTNSTITPNVPNYFNVSGIAEGQHNWSVNCVDTSFLQGNSTIYYFIVDRYPPYNITLNWPTPELNTTLPNINFNWTAYDAMSPNMTCQLVINNTINATVISFNGTDTNKTVSGFKIGNYNWYVNCTDIAGNMNMSETRNFSISDEPPKVSLVYPSNNTAVNVTNVSLTYNATDNFGFNNCTLFVNGALNQTSNDPDIVNGYNNFTIIVIEQWYNWSVSCTDTGDNTVATSNYTFRVDTTLPNIVLNSPIPFANFTASPVVFNYTATDYHGSLLNCSIYMDDASIINSTATSGIPKTESKFNVSDGNHSWYVSCIDFALNTNTTSSRNFTMNQAPSITLDNPQNNSFVRFNVTMFYTPVDNDGLLNCSLVLNQLFNQSNNTINNSVQNNFSLIDPSEGYYNWSVMCYDSGIFTNFNTSLTKTFIVDNTPPNITLLDPIEGTQVNTTEFLFTWNVTDNFDSNLDCNFYLNGTQNNSITIVSSNGTANYTLTGLRTGNYNWNISCIDNATNIANSEVRNFTVLLAPNVSLTDPPDDGWSNIALTTFKYIPSLGSGTFPNCSLILNGQVNVTNDTITPDVENNFTLTLEDGEYNWTVRCYDTNNLLGYGQNLTYYVDTNAPYNITLIYPQNNDIVTKNNVSLTFTGYDTLSPLLICSIFITDYLGGYELDSGIYINTSLNYTYYQTFSDGNYSWNVSCTDIAGNYNESSMFNFTVIAPPNVTLIYPPDNYWNNTGFINLTYYPYDDIQIKNCSLYVNGIYNQTVPSVNKQNNTFSISGWDSGSYNWSVGCYDGDDNLYIPANRTFFIDKVSPSINLTSPSNNQILNTSTVSFNFTAFDNLANNLTCSIYINGTLNQSGIIVNNSVPTTVDVAGFDDGYYDWYVNCTDQATNSNISLTKNFSVQEPPRINLGNPANGTRNNSMNWTLYFTPYDNSGTLTSCTLILNSQQNETISTLTSGVQYGINVTGLSNGNYTWDVNCTDPNGNTGINGTSKLFYVDLKGPEIFLDYPPNTEIFNNNNITFNWTAYDFNSTILLNCTLFVTDTPADRLITGISGFSGTLFNYALSNLSDGMHYWNVTCYDDLNNSGNSTTRYFIINQPDMYINDLRIIFNNTNPDLNETINITANVSNTGGIDANNVIVEFWDGIPGTGILIGNETGSVLFNSSTIFSTLWNITEGYHVINVIVDPYNYINELNETNNNATNNISVLSSVITYPVNNTPFNYGNISIDFTLIDYTANSINYTVFVDNVRNVTGSTIDNLSTIVNVTLSQGIHKINVEANDSLGRRKNSTSIYVIIDYSAPQPVINTQNNTWFNTSTPQINISVTDNLDTLLDYKLYINNTLGPTGNISNGTHILVNISSLGDGIYNLTLEASDDLNNTVNSTVKVIYIDTSPPSVTLHNPIEGQNFTTRTINFNFTVNDNLASYAMCNLSIDNVPVIGFNATIGIVQNYTASNLAEGAHYWDVTCRDQALNNNVSETRSFNVFIPPAVILVSSQNNTWTRLENNTFFYNVSDDTGLENCSIIINGVINQTKSNVQLTNNATNNFTVNFMQPGTYNWQIECYDNTTYHSYNISESRWLYVDTIPPQPYIETQNNTWFNTTTPLIQINITDNMAQNINYTAYVDGLYNINGTISNATPTNITLAALTNGIHTVIIEGTDLAGNMQNSTAINIYVDTIKPSINLTHPLNDTNLTIASTELNFTVIDNLAEYLNCSVTLDGSVIAYLNVSNNTETNVSVAGLSGGYHNWNVTCVDMARNVNTSLTYRFFVVLPDIYVNTSLIFFTAASAIENDTINITAEIRNIGQNNANNFTVEIRLGSPTGLLLGNFSMNLSINESKNVTINRTLPIGDSIFHVLADVPFATNGTVYEANESNNNASRAITVGSWQYVLGYQGGRLAVQDSAYDTVFDWIVQNTTGGNVFATDVDSNINWLNLTALSKNLSNQYVLNDFNDLDTALGMENNSDSINTTYTLSGQPKETDNITVFNKQVIDIPIFNSTNNSNFITGILWDSGDGGLQFNASQDVLFITRIQMNTSGYNGTYDFELRVPARLRAYKGGTDAVALYAELN
jgi:hypothetical protein